MFVCLFVVGLCELMLTKNHAQAILDAAARIFVMFLFFVPLLLGP